MRGSSWGEGEAFTVQPLVPEYQGSQTEHSETNIQETLYLCVTPQPGTYSLSDGSLTITVDTDAIGNGLTEEGLLAHLVDKLSAASGSLAFNVSLNSSGDLIKLTYKTSGIQKGIATLTPSGEASIEATVSDLAYTKSEAEHLVAKATGTITDIQNVNDGSKMIFITETSDSNSTITQVIPAHLTLLKAVGNTVTSGDLLTSLDFSNHSVHIDLDNDGIADEIRYDTKSQRLFVQQLSDESNAQPFVGQSMGRWTDGSQTTPTAGRITNIQDDASGKKTVTLQPVDENQPELT